MADTIAAWAAMDGTVAIRIMMTPEVSTDAADPGINRVLAAAASTLCRSTCWRAIACEQVAELAKRNPTRRS